MKPVKITIGSLVLTKAGDLENKVIKYHGYSEILKANLISAIKTDSIKLRTAREDMIKIIKTECPGDIVRLWGLGSCDYYIGESATKKRDDEAVIHEGEDNGVAVWDSKLKSWV